MKQVFLIVEPRDGVAVLTDAQYDRLKRQLHEQWEKYHPNAPRPLLLEGGFKVQVEDVSEPAPLPPQTPDRE